MPRNCREVAGRGGKTVTTVSGFVLDETALKTLAGELKRKCGVGGAIKDGNIEIQGDQRGNPGGRAAETRLQGQTGRWLSSQTTSSCGALPCGSGKPLRRLLPTTA